MGNFSNHHCIWHVHQIIEHCLIPLDPLLLLHMQNRIFCRHEKTPLFVIDQAQYNFFVSQSGSLLIQGCRNWKMPYKVICHTEKLFIASYYSQLSVNTKIKMIITSFVSPKRPKLVLKFNVYCNIGGELSVLRCYTCFSSMAGSNLAGINRLLS